MPPVSDSPSPHSEKRGDGVQLPDIVSNFQDLSAVLSLLAADTVEQKQSDPNSLLWERMSTAWCLFGIIGLLRAYLKIAVGLMRAEIAGVDLLGAAGLTRKRTKGGRSSWNNGQEMWHDPRSFPLGFVVDSSDTPWTQPHVTIMGYTRCPPDRGNFKLLGERLLPFVWATVTVAITTAPTLILLKNPLHEIDRLEVVTISLVMGVGLFAGAITPALLEFLNPHGAMNLARFHNLLCSEDRESFALAGRSFSSRQLYRWAHGTARPSPPLPSSSTTPEKSPTDSTPSKKGTEATSDTATAYYACAAFPDDRVIAGRTRSYTVWGPNHFGEAPLQPSGWFGEKIRLLAGHRKDQNNRVGSADLMTTRLLAGFTAGLILVSYVSSYLLLSQQTNNNEFKAKKYGWLGAQSAILVLRFVLWGYRPSIIPIRRLTLFYMVSGSVVDPLPVKSASSRGAGSSTSQTPDLSGDPTQDSNAKEAPPPKPCTSETLSIELIRYAAAVARSKRLNTNPDAYVKDLACTPPGSDPRVNKVGDFRGLDRLANRKDISRDIIGSVLDKLDTQTGISKTWSEFQSATSPTPSPSTTVSSPSQSVPKIQVVRIPWDFIEELYAAQGVILSSTPWEYGMIYLGAVFTHPDGKFLGFTAMSAKLKAYGRHRHLFAPGSKSEVKYHEFVLAGPVDSTAITAGDVDAADGNYPKYTSAQGAVDPNHAVETPLPDTVKQAPDAMAQFVNSVQMAWEEQKKNGPASVEIHAQYLTKRGSKRKSKTEPNLRSGLQFARETIKKAQLNINRPVAHENCTTHCKIHKFDIDYGRAEVSVQSTDEKVAEDGGNGVLTLRKNAFTQRVL